jgi:hypothetical protein
MSEAGKQFDHAGVAVGLLPGQFEDSTNLQALVRALVGEDHAIQELEDVLWVLYSQRWLWFATGAAQDGLGDILDEPRASESDALYRDQLYLKVLINVSQGEPERLIEAVQRVTGASEVHLIEKLHATVVLYAHGLVNTLFIYRVPQVAAGGVKTVVTGSESTNPFVFGKDGDASGTLYGEELDYGTGWGESGAGNESEGGDFAELFEQH